MSRIASTSIERFAETLTLNPALAPLREAALDPFGSPDRSIAALTIAEARAWSTHTDDEPWLAWRGRRTEARLAALPVVVNPAELVVGRPDFRAPTDPERAEIEAAKRTLVTMPPFPGGDPGHFHPDYEKLFRLGIGGLQAEVDGRLSRAQDSEKQVFYAACAVALSGFAAYVQNVAEACPDSDLGAGVRRLASEPPSTFADAIRLQFLTMVALWYGEDHGLTTPGRMDQTLLPFYRADLSAGRITPQAAFDLICALFIQCNVILGPGSALSVMVGGRDGSGRDVTNDLTWLCLAARAATRMVYPTVGLAWHEGTPPQLTDFCCRMIATGIGDPAFFNDELIVRGLRDHGVSPKDSFNYMNSTCVEIKVCGASHMWVTAPYFNCPQALLEVMEQVSTGALPAPAGFDAFKELVKQRLANTVAEEAGRLHEVWMQRARTGGFPLASCLISDCLDRGKDFDQGGARYNWVENSFVGLANLADGLVAIQRLVYESGQLTIPRFHEILAQDFRGQEALRSQIVNRLPTYGTDDDEVDRVAVEMADFLESTTEANVVGLHRYVPGFFCWIIHEQFGSQTGATPDGRRAGFPLADGAGGSQGRQHAGPTASVKSTTKWNHQRALGGLVHNVRIAGSSLRSSEDLAALRALIETYLRRGGFEIQVNVVATETLRDAQKRPERYRDLLVRVAGYSDYFVHLNRNMQEEVIQRTEHSL